MWSEYSLVSKWCKISVSGIYTYYITLWHQALFTPNSKSLKGCEMSVPVIYTYCTPLRHQALYTPNSISLRGVWRECIWDLHQLNTTLTPDSIYSIWSHDNKFKRGVKWVYVGFTPIKIHFDTKQARFTLYVPKTVGLKAV